MLPRDLVDEIVEELALARRALAYDETRVRSLESLLELVRTLSSRLRRGVSVEDLLAAPAPPVERARRRQLLTALRTPSRRER